MKNINEAMSATEEHLKSSEIMPHTTRGIADVTFTAWLLRLELWGRINYYYQKPQAGLASFFGFKKRITKNEFMHIVNDENSLYSMLGGKWRAVKDALNKMHYERNFTDVDGKKKKECLFIEIDLKPELRSAL